MTTTWPAYEGSLITSWYPAMQVLNTTSPLHASTSAPNSQPSNTAPDSRASRPLTCSATGDLHQLRRPGQGAFVVVHHHSVVDRQQHTAAQARSPQRRVA